MLRIVLDYAGLDAAVPFLLFKQEALKLGVWRAAFYTHVFSAFLCLAAGMVQFSGELRREQPGLHRGIGKLYVGLILLVNVPCGLVLALYTSGGPVAQVAFTLLDALWAGTTWRAFALARQRQWAAHRCWMIRSFAALFCRDAAQLARRISVDHGDDAA